MSCPCARTTTLLLTLAAIPIIVLAACGATHRPPDGGSTPPAVDAIVGEGSLLNGGWTEGVPVLLTAPPAPTFAGEIVEITIDVQEASSNSKTLYLEMEYAIQGSNEAAHATVLQNPPKQVIISKDKKFKLQLQTTAGSVPAGETRRVMVMAKGSGRTRGDVFTVKGP